MTFTWLFVAAGTALGLVRGLPQLARLLRARDARGVSLDAAATSSVVSAAWAAYGARTGQPAVALASGASALTFALVALAAVRFGRRVRELRAAPAWLLVLAAAGAARGAAGLGLLLSASVLVANGPQLRVAWRERDLSGLSLGTWTLAVAEAAVWGAYGLVAGDRAVLVYGTLHLVTSGAVVALRLAKGPRRRRPAPPGPAAAASPTTPA